MDEITGNLMKALVVNANLMANQARENSGWSKDISASIEVSEVNIGADGTLMIEVSTNLAKAPQAAAFELGSGLHGSKAQKYPITAKNAPALIFFWANPYFGDDPGMFAFKKVMHPGVKARPFLKPAVNKYIPELQQDISSAFVIGLRQLFVK